MAVLSAIAATLGVGAELQWSLWMACGAARTRTKEKVILRKVFRGLVYSAGAPFKVVAEADSASSSDSSWNIGGGLCSSLDFFYKNSIPVLFLREEEEKKREKQWGVQLGYSFPADTFAINSRTTNNFSVSHRVSSATTVGQIQYSSSEGGGSGADISIRAAPPPLFSKVQPGGECLSSEVAN